MSEGETAGVVARPPFIYAAGLAAGIALDAKLPAPDVPRSLRPLGIPLMAGAGVLTTAFFRALGRAGTSVDPHQPTTALVTDGPYRLSRNPVYLAMAMLYSGIALAANKPWAFATLVPTLAVMQEGVIKREERYLERLFGDEYLRFKVQRRRWI